MIMTHCAWRCVGLITKLVSYLILAMTALFQIFLHFQINLFTLKYKDGGR